MSFRALAFVLPALLACGARTGFSTDDFADADADATQDGSLVDDARDEADAAADTSTADAPWIGADSPSHDAESGDAVVPPVDARPDASNDGPSGGCGPCLAGCCDGTTCVDLGAQSATTCGFGGAACGSCGASGRCLKGACFHPQPNCDGTNCPGCCLDSNTCGDGIAGDACGFGGHACQGCGPLASFKKCVLHDGGGGSCQATCDGSNCHGCCDGTTCLLGQSQSSCGELGAACTACPTGQLCKVQGASAGGSCAVPCSPASCKGCCAGDVCAVGDQDIACGLGGGACANCSTSHLSCAAGACAP